MSHPHSFFVYCNSALFSRARRCSNLVWTLLAIGLAVCTASPALGAGGDEPPNGKLGIGVFLQPGSDSNGDGLERTNRLWFALESGASSSRTFSISSTSVITQNVRATTVAGARENGGELTLAPDRDDLLGSWFRFEPAEFVLKPGQTVDVVVTVTAPQDAPDGVNENFVQFQASGASSPNLQYKIPTAIAYVQRSMVTVGQADALAVDFDIVDVEGFKGDSGPSLRIYFDNTGGVPISLAGSTQLSSLDFDGVRSEKYTLRSNVILPGDSGFADVLVSDPVAAGRWRVFVSAYQGSTEKTATFERDLTFDGPPRGAQRPFSIDFMKLVILLVALGLLFAGIRVMKSGKKLGGEEVQVPDPTLNGTDVPDAAVQSESLQMSDGFMDRVTVITGVIGSRLASVRGRLREIAADRSEDSFDKKSSADTTQPLLGAQGSDSVEQAPLVKDAVQVPNEVKSDKEKGTSDPMKEKSSFKVSANALRELKKLLDEGIISQEEFERKRKEILRRF